MFVWKRKKTTCLFSWLLALDLDVDVSVVVDVFFLFVWLLETSYIVYRTLYIGGFLHFSPTWAEFSFHFFLWYSFKDDENEGEDECIYNIQTSHTCNMEYGICTMYIRLNVRVWILNTYSHQSKWSSLSLNWLELNYWLNWENELIFLRFFWLLW